MRKKLPVNKTDGKLDKLQATTLDQLLGEEQNTYLVDTEAEYIEYLSGLNKSELLEHSVKLCVPPTDERERTIKRLVSAFRVHMANYTKIPALSKPRPLSNEAIRILAEGR